MHNSYTYIYIYANSYLYIPSLVRQAKASAHAARINMNLNTEINNLNNDDLKQCLRSVTAEISRLTGTLEKAVSRLEDIEKSSFLSEDEIEVGDTLEITNNYQGLKGRHAEVTRLIEYYVWLILNKNDKPFKRKKSNVVLV